jgi:hypothetical protein
VLELAGLFLSALALHMAAPAGRFVPEPLVFATELLRGALPSSKARPPESVPLPASHASLRWLALEADSAAVPAEDAQISPLQLTEALTKPADDAYFSSAAFKLSALSAAAGVVERAAQVFQEADALPELLQPARGVLRELSVFERTPKVGDPPPPRGGAYSCPSWQAFVHGLVAACTWIDLS